MPNINIAPSEAGAVLVATRLLLGNEISTHPKSWLSTLYKGKTWTFFLDFEDMAPSDSILTVESYEVATLIMLTMHA